jgi:hypothetical protein
MATYAYKRQPLRLRTRIQVQKLIFWSRILAVLTFVIIILTIPFLLIEINKYYADHYQPHENSNNQGGQRTDTVRPNAKYP